MWARRFWIAAIANCAIWAAVSMANGGGGPPGKVENGRYFLEDHGRFTEVTSVYYEYSWVHFFTVVVTMPPASICFFWFLLRPTKAPE